MFKKILIANRGEIALRILRCCKELKIQTLLIYSRADRRSLPVMLADESLCIGPESAVDSYLQQDLIIEIALKTGCDAIHPGYGFLSENSEFAFKCERAGLTFIGPSPSIIALMGDKQAARELVKRHGIPLVPGSEGVLSCAEEAKAVAQKIGYPVLIKASAGGGGKGMRAAYGPKELEVAYRQAVQEAEKAFGCGDVYLEKLITDPRHIEIQLAADKYGNVIHLGERNCSIQKYHQKLLEEAPAFGLSDALCSEMAETAVRAAKACGYDSVGTVEFLVDRDDHFYFIEMNTRIQVEHPVTESICGLDLIRLQIRSAAGKKLPLTQEQVLFRGHAIECRINAKSPGKITMLHFPQGLGVRIESSLYEGDEVSPFYDSMIAKIIVTGESRRQAVYRMRSALAELVIEGVSTNLSEMLLLLYRPDFVLGGYDTSFWEKNELFLKEAQLSASKGS
ncbi:MAG: acetyl-CoA carboxylase biotin carboxylase subunit [Firmicutes bacterium]|nr:acetyl-CoA carboxylase biotin carboxylase subunit [Bacillota bacterium]